MIRFHRILQPWSVGLLVATSLFVGCGEGPVREDRQVRFSKDGQRVGFQHGRQGIYIAGRDGGDLVQVHQPSDDVGAISTPLWSPLDDRLIFTTARRAGVEDDPADGPKAALDDAPERHNGPVWPDWDATPEGATYHKGDTRYRCWVTGEIGNDSDLRDPTELFEARCDHPGYVAANLAVRWSPDASAIYFIDRLGEDGHSLFAFDLQTRETRRVLPRTATALVFEFTQDGQWLVCSTISEPDGEQGNGIWISDAKTQEDWWRVPDSDKLTRGNAGSLLHALQYLQPSWTPDARQLAFVLELPATDDGEGGSYRLIVCDVDKRESRSLLDAEDPLRDLSWHPRDGRLGFVMGQETPHLHTIDASGKLHGPLSSLSVRHFAGWDSTGNQLAFTSPIESVPPEEKNWALLLPPVEKARDRLLVLNESAGVEPREIKSGMRFTFPAWSPEKNEISLWGTFAPSHISTVTAVMAFGALTLQPGDPAAIMDAESGEVRWMTTSANERSQVGHYWLLQGDYAKAWQCYEQAAQQRIEEGEPEEPTWESTVRARQATVFEYVCLAKMGNANRAEERLKTYRREYQPDFRDWLQHLASEDGSPAEDPAEDPAKVVENDPDIERFLSLALPLSQDMLISEVFLSLGLPDEGVAFFRDSLEKASSNEERLSRELALSQFLLLTNQHAEYMALVDDTLGPLFLSMKPLMVEGVPEEIETATDMMRQAWVGLGGLALLPLGSPDFLASIPDDRMQQHVRTWQSLREKTGDDVERLAVDLILNAGYARLGNAAEAAVAAERIGTNPVATQLFDKEALESLSELITEATKFRWESQRGLRP